MNQPYCQYDPMGHCITCSDEALPARIVQIYQEEETALVRLDNASEQEVDISLLDDVATGDRVLIHAGVAISQDVKEIGELGKIGETQK